MLHGRREVHPVARDDGVPREVRLRERKADLRGGAALAGISYAEFLQEVQSRNIVVLENDQFLEELEFLADAFADTTLHNAVQKVRSNAVELPTLNA